MLISLQHWYLSLDSIYVLSRIIVCNIILQLCIIKIHIIFSEVFPQILYTWNIFKTSLLFSFLFSFCFSKNMHFAGREYLLSRNVRGPSNIGLLDQYHGCWCPGSLCHPDISSHDIDYIEYVGPSLTWGWISSTCVKSMWRNDIKCKYMLLFPHKKLARKGLR